MTLNRTLKRDGPSLTVCLPLQVEDAMYFLPNPFPEESLVGVTKQTLAIVDDTDREVPLSEVSCCCTVDYDIFCRIMSLLILPEQ